MILLMDTMILWDTVHYYWWKNIPLFMVSIATTSSMWRVPLSSAGSEPWRPAPCDRGEASSPAMDGTCEGTDGMWWIICRYNVYVSMSTSTCGCICTCNNLILWRFWCLLPTELWINWEHNCHVFRQPGMSIWVNRNHSHTWIETFSE